MSTSTARATPPRTTARRARAPSPLADWLRVVMDDLAPQIHNRRGWADLLGVSEQRVGQWINGAGVPDPRNLDAIVTLLETRYASVARASLASYADLAHRALTQVAPGAKYKADTLEDYRTAAARQRLDAALLPLSPVAQRAVLDDASATANELVLAPPESSWRPRASAANASPKPAPPTRAIVVEDMASGATVPGAAARSGRDPSSAAAIQDAWRRCGTVLNSAACVNG